MLTLSYFGSFEILHNAEPIALPTRPCARLLALVGTEPGHRWRREAVAREIWPEAEWGNDAVSLRTALAMLRRTLGPDLLGSDRDCVWVHPGETSSDLDDFRATVARERREPDADARERALVRIAEFPMEFLTGWESSWVLPLRTEHARAVARAALDLARVRLASGSYEEARRLALRALAVRPGNDGAIAVAVRASVALGERGEALELAAQAGDSPELRRLAEEIAAAPVPAVPTTPTTVPSSDLLFDAFESNLANDPEGAVRFLLANRPFWWRQQEIAQAKRLLAHALEAAPLSADATALALFTLSFLHYRTSHYAEALDMIARGLAITEGGDESLALDLLMVRAIVEYEVRRWEASAATTREIFARLDRRPEDHRRSFALGNRGGYEWHLMRLAAAKADYAEAREIYVGEDIRRVYIRATTTTNLACIAAVEGDWPLTERHAAEAREVMTLRFDALGAGLAESLFCLARAAQGDREVGPQLVRAPLDVVRCGMRRMATVVFDNVAEGLAHLGRGAAALELLDAVADLRSELGHERSPAEQVCALRTEAIARARLGGEVPSAPRGDYAALAAWTVARGDEIEPAASEKSLLG